MTQYLGCVDMREDITHALIENAVEQQSGMSGEKPVDLFISSIRELLAIHRVHISNLSPGIVLDAEIIGNCQGERVYLFPGAAYAQVRQHCTAQGSTFPISKGQLWKRMNEQGLLETTGKDLTFVKSIGGSNQRVLSVSKAALLGEQEEI